MANHSYVYTKKPFNAEKISSLLKRVNEQYFFNLMNIEDQGGFWTLTFEDVNGWRLCWVETSRTFESSHGPGGDFLYWVMGLIQDEVSKEFDGRVDDDGIGDKTKMSTWNTPPDFKSFVLRELDERGETNLFRRFCLARMMMFGCSKLYMKKLRKKV